MNILLIFQIILIIGWGILAVALLRKPNEYTLKNSTFAIASLLIASLLILNIVKG